MSKILITYDLKSPGKDYSRLYEHIKGLGEWWHYLESTWIVKTEKSVDDIANSTRLVLDPNDYLLVVDISNSKKNGWLPRDAWSWINNT